MTKPKAKNKNYCNKCHEKHFPPTGKKCTLKEVKDMNIPSTSAQQMTMSSDSDSEVRHSGVGAVKVKMSARKITRQKDCSIKKGLPSGQFRPSDHVPAQSSSEDEQSSGDVQARILQELQKVNSRLDAVEDKVQEHGRSTDRRDCYKLSTPERFVHNVSKSRKSKKSKASRYVSDSSSEEESLPSLSVLKSSRDIQRQVDARIAEIESHSKLEGNDSKLKSKRGGGVDVSVSKKVAWPHDNVLGGATRQRVTYDQLSLTQFIQGFTRNILDESSNEIRERMLWYLNDLMEDATDFSWGSAKAAHAVLLCEMERGSVTWTNTSRIDRIRCVHAQKHHVSKQNWGKKELEAKKPWFCKSYQFGQCMFSKDHEQGGKIHKHICAHCLSLGKILAQPHKDCNNVKRQNSKNELAAAQHQQAA